MTKIIKGKLYIEPPRENLDFKELFRQLATAGAGRSVDKEGLPAGSWTPELLHEAIGELSMVETGVDLRTVQRWFGENEHGVRAENVRWLARIFGCGEADATIQWQVALSTSLARLQERKRSRPKIETSPASHSVVLTISDAAALGAKTAWITKISARALIGVNSLTLPTILWSGFTALAFLSYIFSVEAITYNPVQDIYKQVGFLWAPSWTIFPVILLPTLVVMLRQQFAIVLDVSRPADDENREMCVVGVIAPYSGLIWATTVVCFAVIFLLQWAGIHLRGLLSGDSHGYMIDWNNVALFRPDVVSRSSAIILSCVAYLYYGFVMWILLNSLVFQVAIASRHCVNQMKIRSPLVLADRGDRLYDRFLFLVYGVTVIALLSVIAIKLQSTYLITSAPNIYHWLYADLMSAPGSYDVSYTYLDRKSIPQLTTLVLAGLILLSGSVSFIKVCDACRCKNRLPWIRLVAIFGLAANVVGIGAYPGFSVLLAITTAGVVVDLISLYLATSK